MHVNTVLMFDKYAARHFPGSGRVLEVGPDRHPSTFQQKFPNLDWETAELKAAVDESGARHYGPPEGTQATHWMPDEYTIPVEDGTFDVVLTTNVAEHVRQVWTWMAELARVVKPGGLVITIAPTSWPYHPSPVDCWRFHKDSAAVLAEWAGLDLVQVETGALERRLSKRTYAGSGMEYAYTAGRRLRLLGRLGWPMSVSEDLVSVARKPMR